MQLPSRFCPKPVLTGLNHLSLFCSSLKNQKDQDCCPYRTGPILFSPVFNLMCSLGLDLEVLPGAQDMSASHPYSLLEVY